MKKPIRRAGAKPHNFTDNDDDTPTGSWADTFREVRVWLLAMALVAFLIVLIAPDIHAATGVEPEDLGQVPRLLERKP